MISNVRSIERGSPQDTPTEDAPAGEVGADEPDDPDFAEHIRPMFRFAVTLSSLEDADDQVQDALARAWAKRTQFDPGRGALRSWLLAVAADQARGRWRRARPLWEVLDPESLSTPATSELGADLQRAVAALPPRQRATVILHHYVDLLVAEVAELLGCSPGTVKSNPHDARKTLDSRVTSARAAITSFDRLYAKARTVAELVQVESTWSSRQADLELLEAQQRALRTQTSLTTVTVSSTVRSHTVKHTSPATHHDGFVGGLRSGWHAFVRTVFAVGAAIGAAVPFLVVLAVIGAAGVAVLLGRRRCQAS